MTLGELISTFATDTLFKIHFDNNYFISGNGYALYMNLKEKILDREVHTAASVCDGYICVEVFQ